MTSLCLLLSIVNRRQAPPDRRDWWSRPHPHERTSISSCPLHMHTHTHLLHYTIHLQKKTTSNRSGVKFQLLTLTDKMRSFIRCDITSQMASKNINMIIIYRPISTRTKTNTGSDFLVALRSGQVSWECLCYSDTGLSTPWHARRHTSTPWTLSSSVSWENYRSMLWILRVSSQAW